MQNVLAHKAMFNLFGYERRRKITWISPLGRQTVTYEVPRQPLKDIALKNGVPIKYKCEQGSCGTCEARIGGKQTKLRICVAKAVRVDRRLKTNSICILSGILALALVA